MTSTPTARTDLLAKAESYLYFVTALILVLAAAGILVAALLEMAGEIAEKNYVRALLHLLDRALLVLMMAEIIYTVRRIAHKRRLEAEPFFIVAIIAAIRRILVITAESTTHIDLSDPTFQAAMVELGLLGLIILALAGAMRLIPSNRNDDLDEDDGTDKSILTAGDIPR